ncbi:hypothetical protein [Antribacter gilvus]|uniref:COG4315 family predicted lipoprotein n=1 Tax=Antribacter gilvus TaxID=2304675 RepID=UPI000F769747|nr:hypothetical protein [Antribacter gilvus]
MTPRTRTTIAVVSLALFGLTGCGGSDTPGTGGGDGYGAPAASEPAEDETGAADDAVTELSTADTDLGTIVVDGEGMTLYQFDDDTQGGDESSCTGQCLTAWPPAHAGDEDPTLEGVTGEVGTITGTDGMPQLTLNGWPLYYFAGDAAPGDTSGQGVNDVWWVLTPEGERITN